MYLYLYDHFLNNKKFNSTVAKIETRLTDLGIGGKIIRLSPLRDINESLADEIRNGIKTVVVVGDDKTLNQMVNVAAKYDITIGLIPVGPENTIAQILGIPQNEAACDILAARIVEKIDLGKINTTYFLSGIEIADNQVTIEIDCENKYKILPQRAAGRLAIYNLRPIMSTNLNGNYFDPKDGFLEVLIQPIATGFAKFLKKSFGQSIIPFKKLLIKSQKSVSVITDGKRVLKTPVKIEVVPKKLKLIVGKGRRF